MNDLKPKTIKELMNHISKDSGININESDEKHLLHMGYYHGYKGCRHLHKKNVVLGLKDFSELYSIYQFDLNIKSLFYRYIMFIETAYKNIVLDIVTGEANSAVFGEIFTLVLNDYKRFQKNTKEYKTSVLERNKLRDSIYKVASDAYQNNNPIAIHYQNKDSVIPIWGIFEMISLGTFGKFIKASNRSVRGKISRSFGIGSNYDTSFEIPHRIIFALKDLRNAIAHNNIIFDTRFCNVNIDHSLKSLILGETGITVDFKNIFDYVVLMTVVLKKLEYDNGDLQRLVDKFYSYTEKLRTALINNISIFNTIFPTNLRNSVNSLRLYIGKK